MKWTWVELLGSCTKGSGSHHTRERLSAVTHGDGAEQEVLKVVEVEVRTKVMVTSEAIAQPQV